MSSYAFSSFDVVLEVLRQSEDIIRFNLPDYNGFTYILPILSIVFETVYSKDMVDKKICGELDTNLSVMKDLGCADLNYVETSIYPLMFLPIYLIWDNADNPDFDEQ